MQNELYILFLVSPMVHPI